MPSAKLIQTSLPPTPPWAAVVSSPPSVVEAPFEADGERAVAGRDDVRRVHQRAGAGEPAARIGEAGVHGVRDVEQELADVGMLAGVGRADA